MLNRTQFVSLQNAFNSYRLNFSYFTLFLPLNIYELA